jgi:hypothetical protein
MVFIWRENEFEIQKKYSKEKTRNYLAEDALKEPDVFLGLSGEIFDSPMLVRNVITLSFCDGKSDPEIDYNLAIGMIL